MRPHICSVMLLALLSAPACAQVRVLPSLKIPGLSAMKPSSAESNMMGLGFLTARNLLSGVDSGDAEPFPCVENDAAAALMTPNTLDGYKALKTALAQQGWTLAREMKAPVGEGYAFLFSKNRVNLLGLWVRAQAPNALARLSICQAIPNWQAQAKSPKPAVAGSAGQAGAVRGTLSFTLDGWRDARTLYGSVSPDPDSEKELVVLRGSVNAKGEVILPLPATVPAAALTPATSWATAFRAGYDQCSKGVSVSDPKVKLLAIDMLMPTRAGVKAPEPQLIAQAEAQRLLMSEQYGNPASLRAVLVFTTGSLKLRGKPSCPGTSILGVNLSLPAGWSVIYLKQRQSDSKLELINAPAEAIKQFWTW